MSVEIDPAELGFQRPFTVEVAQILKIKNPNSAPVAFKVKTTAPKQYCVRPNAGRIEPGHDVEVSVLLQAMKQEPPADARCRDKFLVQSVIITGDKEFTNVAQIWDGVEKSSIQEKKIRVNWLSPNEGGSLEAAATPVRNSIISNGVEATPDAPPPAYSSPSEDKSEVVEADSAEMTPEPEPEPMKSTATSVKKVVGESTEELKEQLSHAQATIDQLTNDLKATASLRQRKATAESEEKSAAPAQNLAQARQGTEGVPIQIVALLCLISFLLAYFFF